MKILTTPFIVALMITLWLTISMDTKGFSQNISVKEVTASRTQHPPKIDGIFDPEEWEGATLMDGFRQFEPVSNARPAFETQVYMMYDNEAIYVAAVMQDSNPDSIATQLGVRDNFGLNADYFGVGFDTYNNQQDAYYFI